LLFFAIGPFAAFHTLISGLRKLCYKTCNISLSAGSAYLEQLYYFLRLHANPRYTFSKCTCQFLFIGGASGQRPQKKGKGCEINKNCPANLITTFGVTILLYTWPYAKGVITYVS